MAVLALVAIVPSAPLLIPELAGPAADDTAPVRAATCAAGERLGAAASTWIAVGAADARGAAVGPDGGEADEYRRTGDFTAYGAAVAVELGGNAGSEAQRRPLPLSMLVAGWLRGRVDDAIDITPAIVDPDASPADCRALGESLARMIADRSEPVGVLVVADGATALTPTAPGGGERESAVALQTRIDGALAEGDAASLAALSPAECAAEGVGGRAAWQVLAGLCAQHQVASEVLYAEAPFGVGYSVVVWTPAGAQR